MKKLNNEEELIEKKINRHKCYDAIRIIGVGIFTLIKILALSAFICLFLIVSVNSIKRRYVEHKIRNNGVRVYASIIEIENNKKINELYDIKIKFDGQEIVFASDEKYESSSLFPVVYLKEAIQPKEIIRFRDEFQSLLIGEQGESIEELCKIKVMAFIKTIVTIILTVFAVPFLLYYIANVIGGFRVYLLTKDFSCIIDDF